MEMSYKNSDIADQLFEDVLDVLEETSRDIEVEELEIA